jgi:DNA polymerase-3 subunit alpha
LADEPRCVKWQNEEIDRHTYGQQLEGLLRNASTHAAGVVINDRSLNGGAAVPKTLDPTCPRRSST